MQKMATQSLTKPVLKNGNWLLKACIFATGLAGIVSEYVMSTLASYMLGNSVIQWTLTISIMLFAMGLGSRLSKLIRNALLDAFIITELLLSLVCAFSATIIYFLSAYINPISPLIYTVAFIIGFLIGLEIPLATRLNEYFEDLRINISSVMEKDYYGALLGGLLFAFIALPYLGLTYTPIILGLINFLVAAALFWQHRKVISNPTLLLIGFLTVPALLGGLFIVAKPIVLYGEQQKYIDKVIYQQQTPYQRIVITQYKDDYWLYLNGNEQFSTYDEHRYHEPLVHPAMSVGAANRQVLILGGGDGLAAREVLKYPNVEAITLVDLDPAVTDLGQNYPLFQRINQNSLNHPKVKIVNMDAYVFLKETRQIYDVIIIDLPDPKTIELARLYSKEFYQLARKQLSKGGVLVTQAGSPFFSREAFLCIFKTVKSAGFTTLPMHNHIPTLGEWGWVIGINANVSEKSFREKLLALTFESIPTKFISADAMHSMLYFGKDDLKTSESVQINREMELALFKYYRNGSWDFY
jgi:spermidine synthase